MSRSDEPLFKLYGGARSIDAGTLRATVALGSERSMDQDPTFAFRIIVDIALRALSPAINDPTTAVLAVDQLHRLLRTVGKRHLRNDGLSDKSGQLRVVFRTPNWEDYVHLAFSEIRACGSSNLQIAQAVASDDREPDPDASSRTVTKRCSGNSICSIAKSKKFHLSRRSGARSRRRRPGPGRALRNRAGVIQTSRRPALVRPPRSPK